MRWRCCKKARSSAPLVPWIQLCSSSQCLLFMATYTCYCNRHWKLRPLWLSYNSCDDVVERRRLYPLHYLFLVHSFVPEAIAHSSRQTTRVTAASVLERIYNTKALTSALEEKPALSSLSIPSLFSICIAQWSNKGFHLSLSSSTLPLEMGTLVLVIMATYGYSICFTFCKGLRMLVQVCLQKDHVSRIWMLFWDM